MSDPKLPQEDGLFEAMVLSELEQMPIQIDIERAITRLRANGFSAEADVLLGRGDAAWVMLRALRDALDAPSGDIEALRRDAERLRGLLAEAQKAVWMNYDGDLLDRIEAALKEVPR